MHKAPVAHFFSLDFDGCIFHTEFLEQPEGQQDVIGANPALWQHIQNRAAETGSADVHVMVGSNRQCFHTDHLNASQHGSPSCFSTLHTISEHLKTVMLGKQIHVDEMLLADIYGKLEPGTSFALGMQHAEQIAKKEAGTLNHESHAQWIFDESKLTVLYAQMHKVALAQSVHNPGAPIVYEFVDDRENILNGLNKFFSAYPEFIPKNLTLILNTYKGDATGVQPYGNPIQGTGEIDADFRNTVIEMAGRTIVQYESIGGGVDVDVQRKNFHLEVEERLGEKNKYGLPVALIFSGPSGHREALLADIKRRQPKKESQPPVLPNPSTPAVASPPQNQGGNQPKITLFDALPQKYLKLKPDGNWTFDPSKQQQQIDDIFQEQILEPLRADPTKKIALLYAANKGQANGLIESYSTGHVHGVLGGSGQAVLFAGLAEKITEHKLQNSVHIIGISTSVLGGSNGPGNIVSLADMDRDLGVVASHVADGWEVKGLQRQHNPGQLAVGGEASAFWTIKQHARVGRVTTTTPQGGKVQTYVQYTRKLSLPGTPASWVKETQGGATVAVDPKKVPKHDEDRCQSQDWYVQQHIQIISTVDQAQWPAHLQHAAQQVPATVVDEPGLFGKTADVKLESERQALLAEQQRRAAFEAAKKAVIPSFLTSQPDAAVPELAEQPQATAPPSTPTPWGIILLVLLGLICALAVAGVVVAAVVPEFSRAFVDVLKRLFNAIVALNDFRMIAISIFSGVAVLAAVIGLIVALTIDFKSKSKPVVAAAEEEQPVVGPPVVGAEVQPAVQNGADDNDPQAQPQPLAQNPNADVLGTYTPSPIGFGAAAPGGAIPVLVAGGANNDGVAHIIEPTAGVAGATVIDDPFFDNDGALPPPEM